MSITLDPATATDSRPLDAAVRAHRTPIRGFRVPDDLWAAAQAKAKERAENLSVVIRAVLEGYVHEATTASRPTRRRYIPVAGKRRALPFYRQRRVGAWCPPGFDNPPMTPVEAMRDTASFFAGHHTGYIDRGFDGRTQWPLTADKSKDCLDGYRAAWFYLNQL